MSASHNTYGLFEFDRDGAFSVLESELFTKSCEHFGWYSFLPTSSAPVCFKEST